MKKLLLFSFLVISNLTNAQKSVVQNDATNTSKQAPLKGEDLFYDMIEQRNTGKYETELGTLSRQMSGTYHGQNSISDSNDIGTSKEDSKINWATDINEGDVQGSLNKFRQQKQEEDLPIFLQYGLVALILGFLFLYYKIFNKNEIDADSEHSVDKTTVSSIINNSTISNPSTISIKKVFEKKEGKIELEILESQIDFVNKIIATRNGKPVCKNLEKELINTNTEKLTAELSHDLISKYSAISKVIGFMSAGLDEETALLKIKIDLTEELNNKTKETL
jgi:hypothetical protein